MNKNYTGQVIATRENNGAYDSDFLALIETDEGAFTWVTTGSTAVGGGFIAQVDATPDVLARYADFYETKKAAALAVQAAYEQTLVKAGSTVLVTGGRKYKGKTGTVTWYGEDKFRSDRRATFFRAKVETADGESFFVPADYLAVQTSSGEFVEAQETCLLTSRILPAGCSAALYVMSEFPAPKVAA
jgi:hypothetical protein